MKARRWGRWLAVVLGAGLGAGLLFYAYQRLIPSRFLVETRIALPATSPVLVILEVIGSSLSTGQSLRFDFIDPSNGERLGRVPAPLSLNADRLKFLGGDERQWWGAAEEVLLLDVASRKIVSSNVDLIARNPVLRSELHRLPGRQRFDVDTDGSLLVVGGDGLTYAIGSSELMAHAVDKPALRAAPSGPPELTRVVSDAYPFVRVQGPSSTAPPPSNLMFACRTVSSGPCTLRAQGDHGLAWQLGEEDLGGKSVLSLEARDADVAYAYVADDSNLAMFYGGVWLYAVQLTSGRVMWTKKL
ncbi:MAG TPA: hypothetical protein VHM70_19190 [Polyangiaceae bacterium]|nr:hypothetical protein [Polyangiaceae bacterium]